MRGVVLPERELVPLRVRWRDDKALVTLSVLALLLWLTAGALAAVTALGG